MTSQAKLTEPSRRELMLFALDRQATELEGRTERLMANLDYSAEMPAEDARLLREAIAALSSQPVAGEPKS